MAKKTSRKATNHNNVALGSAKVIDGAEYSVSYFEKDGKRINMVHVDGSKKGLTLTGLVGMYDGEDADDLGHVLAIVTHICECMWTAPDVKLTSGETANVKAAKTFDDIDTSAMSKRTIRCARLVWDMMQDGETIPDFPGVKGVAKVKAVMTTGEVLVARHNVKLKADLGKQMEDDNMHVMTIEDMREYVV